MSKSNIKLPALHPQTPTSSQNLSRQSPMGGPDSIKTQLGLAKFRRKLAEENAQMLNNKILAWEHEQKKLLKQQKDTKSKITVMLQRRLEKEEEKVCNGHI